MQALQRTPCGAAELGCAEATDSAGVTRLAEGNPRAAGSVVGAPPPIKPGASRRTTKTSPAGHRARPSLAGAAG